MKKVKIFQENSEIVELVDSDESNLQDYTKNLARLFEASTVTTLETDTQSFIFRPSKIKSILISTESKDIEETRFSDIPEQVLQPEEQQVEVVEEKEEKAVDFVTDGD